MSSSALKIKVFDDKGTNLVPISKSTATVGSAQHCDLVLDHKSVEAEHIRVWCEGGRVWVQDLGAPSGTTLNGIRLPHLKPMLVRELDILKLGECPATLGLEPNLIRSPVVKSVNVDEITLTDIKPLPAVPKAEAPKSEPPPPAQPPPVLRSISNSEVEVKKGELEKISRDLADMKLQLQMAKLDKLSGDEFRKQVDGYQEEIARLKGETQTLQHSFAQVDQEKRDYKKRLDEELAELKLKSLRDMKDQRDKDRASFEEWKREAYSAMAKGLRDLIEVKARSSRNFTRDMILEWIEDFEHCAKRILVRPPLPSDESSSTSSSTSRSSVAHSTKSGDRRSKRRHRSRSSSDMWNKIALVSCGLGIFMAVCWMFSAYVKNGTGQRSVASRNETPPDAQPGNQMRAPFAPSQTKGFKKSYTDNILYTSNYADAELNSDFRAAWLKELSRAARSEWKLSETALSSIAAKEIVLIQDLSRIRGTIVAADQERDGATRMRAREDQFLRELKEQLGKKSSVDAYMKLKRGFYTRNQVYLVRENR
jgi:hypothetical protein